jgi:hypothetical protein
MVFLTDGEERRSSYYFSVHLDETKVLADGTPDPAWVREFHFGKDQSTTASRREALSLCQEELARMLNPNNDDAGGD